MLIKTQSLRPSGSLGFYFFGLLQPAGFPRFAIGMGCRRHCSFGPRPIDNRADARP